MLSKGESESFQQKIILQIKNLSKVYYRNAGISSIANADDEYTVLNNLSMDIKDGEFVTIVGPSGAVKGTLLNIIAGIDREYSGGEILFNGLQSDHITSYYSYQSGQDHYLSRSSSLSLAYSPRKCRIWSKSGKSLQGQKK